MRSRHADRFNHDEDAPGYDQDVLDESNPIRAGYQRLLGWVAERAAIDPASAVLELGSGTGNLTLRLLSAQELVCVDVSEAMTEIARGKVALAGSAARIRWVNTDLLEYFDARPRRFDAVPRRFDAVVSAYTVHHLTEDEKELLFEQVRRVLKRGGRAVFGDLMFESCAARRELLDGFRRGGCSAVVEAAEDEFFWDLARARRKLESLGFEVEVARFGELSWGVAARLVPR